MKKIVVLLFIALLSAPALVAQEQEKVTGSKKQLIQEILALRKELADLKLQINQEGIALSDTLTLNDSIHSGALSYTERQNLISSGLSNNTDSLLSIFYLQRLLSDDEQDGLSDLDSADFKALLPDSVYINRLKSLNSFITLPYNEIVKNHIVYYTQKMPAKIESILGLASYYMPVFEEIFDQNDLPLELKVMAIIESALKPTAVSRAKARGMWQFMYRTGLQYGLDINSYVDERYDPIVSGHAAAKYLKDSYTIFGDWALAIASYNCGAGNVNKAIRRAGSREFWNIYPYLPKETRGYVPSFVAALYTLKYYKEHGIKPLKVEMPAHIDTFHVAQKVHFEQISDCIGISVDELRDLNPQYLRDVVPGAPYILRLPHNYTSLFAAQEKDIYKYKDSLYFNPILLNQRSLPNIAERGQTIHKVRSGENLGIIARKYGVKVSDLQYWNNIKSTIRPGQKLVVYSGNAPARTIAANSGSSSSSASSSGKVTHTVRSGESLGSIAQKYGVSVANLKEWNKISGNLIQKGKKLAIYTKEPPLAASDSGSENNSSSKGGSASYKTHTIKKGETLWSIAQSYDVSLNDLLEINGLNKKSKLMAGKKIKIREI